jgi:Na+/melibiose symporter-like transporter
VTKEAGHLPTARDGADNESTGSPRIGLPTKIAYGFGSVAYGVKDNGFNYFLLIFYSQVVGVNPGLVSTAILVALVCDAISDPIVGYWSDNTRSRWGRRHPFMYAAAIPVSLSFFFLWTPPQGWSERALFWYILVLAVVIRTFITFYETPSSALAPEFTDDYDERSSILSFRYYFGWTGGNSMTVLMFFFLFPAFVTSTIADGQFNRDAYRVYGLVASLLIFAAIMISSVGTHHRIPYLRNPPAKRQLSLLGIFREILETLLERSFIALFVAALFGAVATGLGAGLAFYFLTYMWGFDSIQRGWITMGTFLSALIGFGIAPWVTRTIGKKKGAIIIGLVAFLGAPLPVTLRLFGLLPENGTAALFWIVFLAGAIDTGLIICYQILSSSMVADLVEQAELRTKRRSEGVFFAASTFIRKSVQGLGLKVAALVLLLADFPQGADPSQVSDDAVWSLGAFYVPTIIAIWLLMIGCVSFYKVDRQAHEENLRLLERSREEA